MSDYLTWEDIDAVTLGDETPEREPFAITDDSTAEWAVKKIAEERRETARIDALANEEIERLQAGKRKRAAQTERRTGFLTAHLMRYFDTVPDDQVHTTKTQQKYKLLSGDLIRKTPGPKFERDDAALTEWAKQFDPALVETIEKPKWAEIKKVVKFVGDTLYDPNGEAVPGVTVVFEPARFEVKLRD